MTTSIYQGGNFYVYLITDLNPVGEARYYIGSRTRITLVENNVNPEDDLYMGSSSHVDMIQGLKERPEDFEKVIIETHNDSDDCVLAEKRYQLQHKAVENSEFFNGVYANSKIIGTSSSAALSVQTKMNDIDENGLNGIQRSSIKRNTTMSSDIDDSGLDGFQRVTIKRNTTMSSDIDENGLNGFQRSGKKMSETRTNNIDEDGLNCFQLANVKRIETLHSDIDENGLNGAQRARFKQIETMKNEVNDDGLNSLQAAALKGNKAKGYFISRVGHKDYGSFHSVFTLAEAIGNISDSSIRRHAKKNFEAVITKTSYSASKYLQSLPYNPVGMTWAEIGFFVCDE